MNSSIDVIRRYTKPWPVDNPKRYYAEFWEKRFAQEIEEYHSSHDVRTRGQRIAVYYDASGELHIINCSDSDLEKRIRGYMERWYDWVCKKEFDEPQAAYSIALLLEPYKKEIKVGFYQIRYKDMTCNVSSEQLSDLHNKHAEIRRLEGTKVVVANTGIPRIDSIISRMIYNGDIFPYEKKRFGDVGYLDTGSLIISGGNIYRPPELTKGRGRSS